MNEKGVLAKAIDKIQKSYKKSILQIYIDLFGHLRLN